MIWILVGLVAASIVGFLYYLYVVRWNALARHGGVGVPGDEVIELPAGEIAVYYQDSQRFRHSDKPQPWRGFSVLLSDAESGERIDLGPPPDAPNLKARGKNRIPYATAQLPRAGRYRVVSQIDTEAIEPRITFG